MNALVIYSITHGPVLVWKYGFEKRCRAIFMTGYMCSSSPFHCRRLKTHWGWCSTNWGRRRGIWWGVPVRQPSTQTVNSHIISVTFYDFTHVFRKTCFLQWKMRIQTWTFQKTKAQTATWKSADLLSHGLHETASWQVRRRGIAMHVLWSTTTCLKNVLSVSVWFHICASQK